MKAPRILFWGRQKAVTGRAGEANYVSHLVEGLRRRGIAAETSGDWNVDLRRFPAVHFSNLQRIADAEWRERAARGAGAALILTPIYLDPDAWIRQSRFGISRWLLNSGVKVSVLENLRAAAETCLLAGSTKRLPLRSIVRSAARRQGEMLRRVDLLWPNSHLEAERLRDHFGRIAPYRVVRFGTITEQEYRESRRNGATGEYDVALVGYLAPVKNQINILRALRGIPLRAILVGSPARRHRAYARAVLREAAEAGWELRPSLDRPALLSLLAETRVVIQASWFETCGMTALEGLGFGGQAVLTSRGYGREYFGNRVHYVNPEDLPSIRQAVLAALSRARDEAMGEAVRDEFSWERSVDAAISSLEDFFSRNFAVRRPQP